MTPIEEARSALHALLTGRMASVYVDQNGEKVEYRATTVDRLRAYISELEGRARPSVLKFTTSKGLI